MFRPKKKTKSVVRRRQPRDDEDEEEPIVVLNRPSKKKPVKPVIRSFVASQEEEDESTENKTASPLSSQTRRKKRPRMAFGGSKVATVEPQEESIQDDDDEAERAILYDPEALSQLQAEQEAYRRNTMPQENEPSLTTDTSTEHNEPVIVSGDQALRMTEGDDNALAREEEATEADPTFTTTDTRESRDWEAQVERRAGVSTTKSSSRRTGTTSEGKTTTTTTLEQLRLTVQRTVLRLQQDMEESTTNLTRRQGAIDETEALVKQQQETLQETGGHVEFYQGLRIALVAWTGALRDLHAKVVPLQKALHEVQAGVAAVTRGTEWEDDCLHVLHQSGRLTKVVGRQPDPQVLEHEDTTATVDEFGRSVVSQYVMARQQRQKRYAQLRQEQQVDRTLQDSTTTTSRKVTFCSQAEMEELRQRHNTLQQALEVAVQELDPAYTDLENLVHLFENWRHHSPTDYQESYASLSLADLAAVLVLANLCALNDPWNESAGYNEAKWTAVVHAALASGTLDQSAVDRLVSKAVVPAVNDLLKQHGVALEDERAMKATGEFVGHVAKVLPSHAGPALQEIQRHLAAYGTQRLDAVAVAVVSMQGPATSTTTTTPDELALAIHAATVEQMHRVTSMVVHLIRYWAPILPDPSFGTHVLSFLADAYLCLLSSVRQFQGTGMEGNGTEMSATESFGAVWHELQSSGWLQRSEPSVAILRVAAQVFQVPTGTTTNQEH